MKKNVIVHIPKPCHEDWQQMTPVDKGRFCQSCAKQVVDFSMMSGQQVLQHIAKAAGGMCGRFANDQLQRPLLPAKQEKKKIWWLAAAVPLMMVFEKVRAQKKQTAQSTTAAILKESDNIIMGKVRMPEKNTVQILVKQTIKGKVIDENGKMLPFAEIKIEGEYTGVQADSIGSFSINIQQTKSGVFVETSLIGYETKKQFVPNSRVDCEITLKSLENILEPVIIPSFYAPPKCTVTMGATYLVKSTDFTKPDSTNLIHVTFFKIIDSIKKTANIFSIYPNPAQRGRSITIDTKKEGDYSIQLFNNSGKLLQVKEFNAMESATLTTLDIPTSFAAGIYYVRLVDEKTKKQYTDKIVVR